MLLVCHWSYHISYSCNCDLSSTNSSHSFTILGAPPKIQKVYQRLSEISTILSSSIIILMISELYVLCVPSSHPQNAVINFLLKFVYIKFCHWGSAYDPPYCTASAKEDFTQFIPIACVMIKLHEHCEHQHTSFCTRLLM